MKNIYSNINYKVKQNQFTLAEMGGTWTLVSTSRLRRLVVANAQYGMSCGQIHEQVVIG